MKLTTSALAIAAAIPLALAGAASATDPPLTMTAKAPATAHAGDTIAVRYGIQNHGRAQRNVEMGITVPDQENIVALNCGPLGRPIGDLSTPGCVYAYLPAGMRVQATTRLRICTDCLGQDTEVINEASINGTGIGASAITKIISGPTSPAPTGGTGLVISILGLTIRLG